MKTPWTKEKASAQQKRWQKKPGAKQKMVAGAKRFHSRNPDYKAFDHIKRRYGLTRSQYETLLYLQGGRCAICRRGPEGSGKKRLTVDHDHETGEVRGLLCNHCNAAIGNLRDDPLVVRAAAAYLESDHHHVGLVKAFV